MAIYVLGILPNFKVKWSKSIFLLTSLKAMYEPISQHFKHFDSVLRDARDMAN